MKQVKKINLKSIRKYNPGNLDDNDVINNYICRSEVFAKLIKEITSETKNSIPQHHLIVGQRGMGKTTLLKRIEVEIRTQNKLNDKFVPVQYPEEQYNIDRLSKFWFNTLDILVDYIDTEIDPKQAREFDIKIHEIKKENDENTLANKAYKLIEELLKQIGKRPVLLIDNIDQLFSLLKETELWDIRQKITDNGAPIFIGASSSSFDEVFSYYQPFYDHFKLTFLNPLTETQFTDLILTLSDFIEDEEIRNDFHKNKTRIKSLFRLAGGNIRTAIILFSSLSNGFGKSIADDLDELLDEMTPIYKARIEELSNQLKAIVDEIALEHNPIDLIALRERTKMSNNTLSPQVKRLRQMGWITTEGAIKGRGNYYEITERFFNVWYLMRRSTRRNKKNISALSSFLNEWIDQKEVKGTELLSQQIRNSNDITTRLALSELLQDGELKSCLIEHAKEGVYSLGESDPSILKEFSEFREDETKENYHRWESKYNKLLTEEKYSIAEKLIKSTLPKLSNDQKILALTNLAYLYSEHLEKYSEAEKIYEKIIQEQPQNIQIWNELGLLYHTRLNDYEKAEIVYRKGLKIAPKDGFLLNNLGNLLSNLHKYDDAVKVYKEAIATNETFIAPMHNLSIIYITQFSRYEEAEILLKKALKIDPTNSQPWNTLGYIYQYHYGKYAESKSAYEKSIQNNPKYYHAWYNLGNLYQTYIVDYTKSEKAYKTALEINPSYSSAWNGLAMLYSQKLNKHSLAEHAYEKAISMEPNNPISWNGLGNLFQDHLNNSDKALECYKKGLELDPTIIVIKLNLIFLLRDILGRTDEAKVYFTEIKIDNINEAQDTFYLHKALFNIYEQNFGNAKEDLNKAIDKLENTPPSLTIDDWIRFAAIAIDKGFGKIMINQFKENGIDIIMRPYYEACVALHSGGEDHIHRQAAEVRDTTFEIYEYLKKYKAKLFSNKKAT